MKKYFELTRAAYNNHSAKSVYFKHNNRKFLCNQCAEIGSEVDNNIAGKSAHHLT